jgi:hypothetical protein
VQLRVNRDSRNDLIWNISCASRRLRRIVEGAAAPERASKSAVPPFQSPEPVSLYETYAAGPVSIEADLETMTVKAGADDPLIVATGTDMAIFPGGGRPPAEQSFAPVHRGALSGSAARLNRR